MYKKINKLPEFYITFARKIKLTKRPIFVISVRKNIFPFFWGGGGRQIPPSPLSPTPMHGTGVHLCNEAVKIGVGGTLAVEVAAAEVEDGFVVDHKRAVGVLEGRVGRQDRVVWLDDGRRHARCRVDGKLQLGLLGVLHAEAFHQQRREAGARTAAETASNTTLLDQITFYRI